MKLAIRVFAIIICLVLSGLILSPFGWTFVRGAAYVIEPVAEAALDLAGVDITQFEVPDYDTPEGLRKLIMLVAGVYLFGGVSLAATIGLIFLTPIGEAIMRLLAGTKKPSNHHLVLLPDVRQIAERVGYKRPITVVITEEDAVNSFSFGARTIGVSERLLHTLSPELVEALLAHEVAHLKKRHGQRVAWIFGCSWVALVAAKKLGKSLNNIARRTVALFWVFGLPALILCIPGYSLILLHSMGKMAFELALSPLGRRDDFEADEIAAQAGYGEALMRAIKEAEREPGQRQELLNLLWGSHPPVHERITHIKEAMQQIAPHQEASFERSWM